MNPDWLRVTHLSPSFPTTEQVSTLSLSHQHPAQLKNTEKAGHIQDSWPKVSIVGGWDHHTNLHSFPPISIPISSPNPRRTMTNSLHTHQWLLSDSPIHPQSPYSFVNTNTSATAREKKYLQSYQPYKL